MKKRILAAFLSVLIIVSLIAVSRKYFRKTQNKTPEKITVLLDWFPNTNHTGLYVAKENKYFSDSGLEVEIIQPSEGENIQVVAAGKAQFAVSSQEAVTMARAEDIPVVSIAAVIQHNTSAFASLKDSNIRTVRDFEGKRYGGWGSPVEEAVLKAVMGEAGADYSKLENVTIGTTDFFTTIGRDSDFQWIFYGWDGIAAQQRGIDMNLIYLKDLSPVLDYYTPVLISSENYIKNKKDLAEKFTRAVARGYQYSIDHPDRAAEILIKNAPELDRDLVNASQEWLSKRYRADTENWGRQDLSVWQRYVDWLFTNKLIKKQIEAGSAFTNELLP